MVIHVPRFSTQRATQQGSQSGSQPAGPQPDVQHGTHLGLDPAWARFTRVNEEDGSKISLKAYKPDMTAHNVLGCEPQGEAPERGLRERNSHNSSVYVASLGRWRNKPAANLTRLPVIGEIAAGQYDVTVAFQEYDCLDHEGGIPVEKALAKGGAYALRVRGASMTHVGIDPGDVVIVRPQNWADDGDFVVANYTDGDGGGAEGLATLKRFYKRRDHVFLQSATASKDPIRIYPAKHTGAPERDPVKVQGVVTMVLKS